ncbi:hypothetical protein HJC23_013294, partial [Cyclotella cryptica]
TSNVGRICTRTIPSVLLEQVERLVGRKQLSKLEKLMNRSLQIVYLVIVLGSWSIIFTYGYEAIENSNHIHNNHKYVGYAVFAVCMTSWHYACTTSPGNITAQTISLFDHYEYDNLLYTNRECPTLKIRKVARSKYDRCTKRHVPRFDHFCGWLNQVISSNSLLHYSVYGSWAMATALYGEVVDKNLLSATFFDTSSRTEVKADYIIVFHYMCMRYFEIMGVLLLMTVMSVCLGMFLGFHLYITARNMTTNEFFKWKAVHKWHKKETRKYQLALKNGTFLKVSKQNGPDQSVSDLDVGCTGPIGEAAVSEAEEDKHAFDPGPIPQNIYNKGVIANFMEVLRPLSFREKAIQRYKTSLRVDGCLFPYETANVETTKPKSA